MVSQLLFTLIISWILFSLGWRSFRFRTHPRDGRPSSWLFSMSQTSQGAVQHQQPIGAKGRQGMAKLRNFKTFIDHFSYNFDLMNKNKYIAQIKSKSLLLLINFAQIQISFFSLSFNFSFFGVGPNFISSESFWIKYLNYLPYNIF